MPAEHELVLTRLIDAPREKLYRCWSGLPDLMTSDSKQAERVMGALMTMQKVDIQALKDAAGG